MGHHSYNATDFTIEFIKKGINPIQIANADAAVPVGMHTVSFSWRVQSQRTSQYKGTLPQGCDAAAMTLG